MKKRLSHIDLAKGLCIILVVYGHAAVHYKGYPVWDNFLSITNPVIWSFAMPMFFIISGCFQRTRLENPDISNKDYFVRATRSLLLPFYSLSFVYLLVNLTLGRFTHAPSLGKMLYALVLEQSNGKLLPSGVLWFLFTLYSIQILTFLHIRVLKLNILYLMVVAILLKSDLNIFSAYHYFAFHKISIYFIYYVLGYYFSTLIREKPFQGKKDLLILFGLYIVTFGSQFVADYHGLLLWISKASLAMGLPGIFFSLFFLGVCYWVTQNYSQVRLTKILIYYGTYSIIVYVFHMPTFTVFKNLSPLVIQTPNYLSFLSIFIPGITLPFIYGKILSLNKTAYKLLIGRTP